MIGIRLRDPKKELATYALRVIVLTRVLLSDPGVLVLVPPGLEERLELHRLRAVHNPAHVRVRVVSWNIQFDQLGLTTFMEYYVPK